MLVVLLQISSSCKLLVRLTVVIELGKLHECCLYALGFRRMYACVILCVELCMPSFGCLMDEFAPLSVNFVLWVLDGGHRPVEPVCLVCMNYIL